MKTTGIWDKCLDGEDIFRVLRRFKGYSQKKFTFITGWIESSKVLDKCSHIVNLTLLANGFSEKLKGHSQEEINLATEWMKTTGAWDKCLDGEDIPFLLSDVIKFSQEELNFATEWMQTTGAWDKCDYWGIRSMLDCIKGYPREKLNLATEWMKTSGILDKCQNGKNIITLLRCFNNHLKHYIQDELIYVTEWMKIPGLLDKFQDLKELSNLLSLLKDNFKDHPQEELIYVTEWIKSSNVLDKCQNAKDIIKILPNLMDAPDTMLGYATKTPNAINKRQKFSNTDSILQNLKDYPEERLSFSTDWMKRSGAWDKCQNAADVIRVLRILKDYPEKRLVYVANWIITSKAIDKCQNIGDVISILLDLKYYPEERLDWITRWITSCQNVVEFIGISKILKVYPKSKLDFAFDWMESSGALNKCSKVSYVTNLLQILKDYPEERLSFATDWMKTSGVWDKCPLVIDVISLLQILKDYPEERLSFATNWIITSKAIDKCQNAKDIIEILKTLEVYPKARLAFAIGWIESSGALNLCPKVSYVTSLLQILKDYPEERLNFATDWMKRSGAWDKCQNATGTINILQTLKDYPDERLVFATNWLESSGALNKCRSGTIISHLLKGLKSLDIQALSSTEYELPIQEDFLPIYIIGATLENISEKCKEALQSFIENPDTRIKALKWITNILGEESAITQEFLLLALGYDNSDDPDGFLAVYQEMMQKRDELVQPPFRTQTPGVILNIDRVQEPRATASLHMPLNVWTRLFDSLKTVERDTLAALYGDVNYNSLLELETNQNITSLLDPKDSLVTKDRVCSHSFMLRDVLKRIQTLHQINPIAAIASFSQLLVNMTTCPTGKLNGITHTYLLMNKDTVLDESELGSETFVQGITHHLNEELRRFREGTLSTIVKSVVKGPNIDPHDIYYVRGTIGGDIGLLFEGESPRIDMNGNMVNSALRKMSKQDLLNLFYQYYTVEEVITLFHTKLNNGSFKIEDLSSGKNLTLKVINEFLREDAFDVETERYNPDYIVVDPSGKPVGLTPLAAKNLLLQLGFLKAVPHCISLTLLDTQGLTNLTSIGNRSLVDASLLSSQAEELKQQILERGKK